MRRRRVPIFTACGLALLLAINLAPPLLVVRQGLSPEADSAGWPLRLLPSRLTLENLATLLRTQDLARHVGLSLWVALASTLLALAAGFPAGWGAARLRALGAGLTRGALISRILPPIALAIPLAALLIPAGLYDHPLGFGLILTHVLQGLPFAILFAYAAYRDVPRELEESAAVDGCSPWQAYWRVTLPAARGAVGGAFILIFLLSWDEFTYAILIQITNRTMPPLIYYYTNFGQLAAASAMAVIMLIPAVLVIGILLRLLARGALAGGVNE